MLEVVKQRVKPPQVEISGKLDLRTVAPDGVGLVKEALTKAQKAGKESVDIRYLGSGTFKVTVVSSDYKTAEKILEETVNAAVSHIEEIGGSGHFKRVET